MGGGNFTKVEAAKRSGQVQNEERGKAVEVHLAKWFSVEYREEVHEKEDMESSSTKRPRKDGGLQRIQRELPMKQQPVRTVSIHQDEFLWQSTATWEQLWERKKGRLVRSQTVGRESPKHG